MRNVTCQNQTNRICVYLHRQNLYETSGQEEMSFGSRKFSNSVMIESLLPLHRGGFMIHLSHYPRTDSLIAAHLTGRSCNHNTSVDILQYLVEKKK
ncbi:hypothetical protein CEXT_59731 [Caerostris extrusa]|uniref:Uncharacterized protein n=1 Tax=Caerostris extrusa TaxID=172846 RepID=A0AAV4XWS5_CAEEX|nr:hypothetical protein CEXT_59731 [Caerostris extrusa]